MRLSARAVAGWAVGTCLVSWALSACLSPTLPLPPPGEPTVAELNADGKSVRILGHGAIRGAQIIFLNEQLPDVNIWVFADSLGDYRVPALPVDLSTSSTNAVEIWQTYASDSSPIMVVHVPYGVAFGAKPLDDAGANASEAGPSDAGASDGAE
jgi:hypothetical protein